MVGIALMTGCADNAVFDLEITLPPSSAPTTIELDVRPGGTEGFDVDWAPTSAFPTARFELAGDRPTRVLESIVAESIEQDALVRIRFCPPAGCAGLAGDAAPVTCLRFERPFHRGVRSIYRSTLGEEPPPPAPGQFCSQPPRTVTRCEVGCGDGDWHDVPTNGFCIEGAHVCDS